VTPRPRYIRRYKHPSYPLPLDPEVEVDPDNFAHGVWTALAITLAEPLRKALADHVEACGCGKPGGGGIAWCATGSALWDLLPAGDQVLFG
jgi:hypothetical protein